MQVYTSKRDQLLSERRASKARVLQRQAEFNAAKLEAESLARQIEINKEQLSIRSQLLKSGYTSRRAYLQAKVSLEDTMSRHFSISGRRDSVKEQLIEAKSKFKGSLAESLKLLNEERAQFSVELAELEQKISKHKDRVDRLAVKSPIRGIVQELVHKTPGEVVRPGDLVAKIVPINSQVVAEVRVDPKDIGHVKVGDQVEVKLSTFDPNVFGVVTGRIDVISATTFKNEEGNPYYKVVVALNQRYVGKGNRRRLIQPGMVAEANIITGSKSLIKYLLKPVYRSLDIGFSER
jgi:HlyD family secretion protein/adhesin transport system membrane fusion protein